VFFIHLFKNILIMKKLFPIICLLCTMFIISSCEETPPPPEKNFFENTAWEFVNANESFIVSTTLLFEANKFTLTTIRLSYTDLSSTITTYSGAYTFESFKDQTARLYFTTKNDMPFVSQLIVYTFEEKLRLLDIADLDIPNNVDLDNVTGESPENTVIPTRLKSTSWLKRDIVEPILFWEEQLIFKDNTCVYTKKYTLEQVVLFDETINGFYVYDKRSGKGALLYEIEVIEITPSENEEEEDTITTYTEIEVMPFKISDNKLTFDDEEYFLEKN